MISQITRLKTENLYPLNKTNSIVEEPMKAIESEVVLKDTKEDILTISENGKIDLSLFNFLDKGGDVSNAISDNLKNDVSFAIKPNFQNVSKLRYDQLKAEIERNFADDPNSKSKYLNSLDKAFNDYIQIQTKLANEKSEKDFEYNQDTQDKPTDVDKTKDEKDEKNETEYNNKVNIERTKDNSADAKKEMKDDKTYDKQDNSNIDNDDIKNFYDVNYDKIKVILEKVFGNTEDNYSDEMSEIVDDFFLKSISAVN